LSEEHFNLLSTEAKAALSKAEAMPLSYGVRYYAVPGNVARLLVVLGEAHMKLGPAYDVGKQVVASFPLRGVETAQMKKIFIGPALRAVIYAPRIALRVLSLGAVKGSTILEAKTLPDGHTVEIEKGEPVPLGLHVASVYITAFFALAFLQMFLVTIGHPIDAITWIMFLFNAHFLFFLPPALLLRRKSWSWVIHPFIGILTLRDTIMANGTVKMLGDHPEDRTAIAVMGRAHLPGFEREIVEKHGFRRIHVRGPEPGTR
jgi:hypothetical protein